MSGLDGWKYLVVCNRTSTHMAPGDLNSGMSLVEERDLLIHPCNPGPGGQVHRATGGSAAPPTGASSARLEAGNPSRNGAARNFEQINALDSWCDHRHPSCKSGRLPRSNGKYRLAMKNAIYNVQEKYTRWGAVFQTINGCARAFQFSKGR